MPLYISEDHKKLLGRERGRVLCIAALITALYKSGLKLVLSSADVSVWKHIIQIMRWEESS